jgi:hypothetical protein
MVPVHRNRFATLRFDLGMGSAVSSPESEALSRDGYALGRLWVGGAAAFWLTASEASTAVALGPFLRFGSGIIGNPGGPKLRSDVLIGGVSVPVAFRLSDAAKFVVTPYLGAAGGLLGYSDPSWHGGVGYGLDVSVWFPRALFGLGLGYIDGAVKAGGALDLTFHPGGWFIGLEGIFFG